MSSGVGWGSCLGGDTAQSHGPIPAHHIPPFSDPGWDAPAHPIPATPLIFQGSGPVCSVFNTTPPLPMAPNSKPALLKHYFSRGMALPAAPSCPHTARRARQNSPSHRDCWQEAIWQTTCLEETNVSEPPNHLIANKHSPHVNNYGDPGTVSSSVEGRSWQPGNTPWQEEKLRFRVNAGGMSISKPAWIFPGVALGSGWPGR